MNWSRQAGYQVSQVDSFLRSKETRSSIFRGGTEAGVGQDVRPGADEGIPAAAKRSQVMGSGSLRNLDLINSFDFNSFSFDSNFNSDLKERGLLGDGVV